MQCTMPSTYDFHVLFSSLEETPLRNRGMTKWVPNHRKKGAARNVEGDPELRLGSMFIISRCLLGLIFQNQFSRPALPGEQ
jgi:hypothetical protein